MIMEIRPIRTETDHEAVLAEIGRLTEMEPRPGSREGDRLEVLAVLSEAYEAKHYSIEPADSIDAIEFMMQQKGLGRSDLEPAFGRSGRISEVLNRRRPLSINMIRALVCLLDIPADILVRLYSLASEATTKDEDAAAAGDILRSQPIPLHPRAANSNEVVRSTKTRAVPHSTPTKPLGRKAATAKKPAQKTAASGTKWPSRAAPKRPRTGGKSGTKPTGLKR
jgi:HTH-type transcriptional regulator/antitoxin HigA